MIAKKAETTVPKLLVEITIFIIVLVVFIGGASTLIRVFITKPQTVTVNSMNLLHRHIKYFDPQTSDSFPLQVDKKHIIKAYDMENAAKPSLCKSSCLCIITSADGEAVQCRDAESSTNDDIRFAADFEVLPEDNVQNYYLEKDGEKFNIYAE